jgi:hypothetical protein
LLSGQPGEKVPAVEDHACFVVDLAVGSQDGSMEVVAVFLVLLEFLEAQGVQEDAVSVYCAVDPRAEEPRLSES